MSTPNPTRLAEALAALEEEERLLANELSSLKGREKEVLDRLMELRDAIGPIKKLVNGKPRFSLTQPQDGAIGDVPISQAIDKLLSMLHKPMTAPEIARELLARGYRTESQNFPNLVGATLRRLEGKKFERKGENHWSYML